MALAVLIVVAALLCGILLSGRPVASNPGVYGHLLNHTPYYTRLAPSAAAAPIHRALADSPTYQRAAWFKRSL